MGAPTVLITILLLFLPALSHAQLYNLIAPNVFRVECEEKVIVESHDYNSQLKVHILLQDFPNKKNIYHETEFTLNATNNFLGEADVKIPANLIEHNRNQKKFLYLTAKSVAFSLEKVILILFQYGYIFIQTDKPLYTPSSKVLYRLFAVDHQFKPSSGAVTVDIVNPDDIVVKRQVMSSSEQSGIISSSFDVPGVVNVGFWKIVAVYSDAPQKNFSTEFEVKEYVLPSFEVKVESRQNFFYVDDNELTVDITARYLYGKQVDGTAYVLFGVQMDDEKISISESLRRIPVENGKGIAKLTRNVLIKTFPNVSDLVGHSLYVVVTVLTNAGSDMVDAEKTGIKVVTSPYKILFTKTSKYFKPGMPSELMVYVINPDDSPANGVLVVANPGQVTGMTHGEGTAKLTINTPNSVQNLQITVNTEISNLPAARQATASMIAQPYRTKDSSNNYLLISVATTEVTPGENININFNLKNDPGIQDKIKYFTYVIMSKGRIIKVGRQVRQSGQALVTMSLTAKEDFIPSFRVIAYYTMDTPKGRDVVSDSLWVDVKDTCMGTLQVKPAEDRDKLIQEPMKKMKLKLTGDPGAKVGLVAVDKGVFVLSKKNKLTQAKVWDVIEKNDIGCTPGGGADNMGVFHDAGLVFHSNVGISTESRSASSCPVSSKRKRRSVVLIQVKGDIAKKYQHNRQLKKCCEDGMHENPMGHSCEQRAEYISDGKTCVDAFLDCCNFIRGSKFEKLVAAKEKTAATMQFEALVVARSDLDDAYLSEEDITSRTQFPESWLWSLEQLPGVATDKGLRSKDILLTLKDSITTWVVQAISLSSTKGICVAEPYEIMVMKDFFIDLHLPYSVVRHEQVEIKAIVHNFSPEPITARLQLIYNEHLCSIATPDTKYFKEYSIRADSSITVPYVIVPMMLGEMLIEIKGSVMGKFVDDGVKKMLRVIPEGMKVTKNIKNVILNPTARSSDGKQKELVEAIDMKNVVPNTEPETFVSVKGDIIGEMVENSIDAVNLKHLIRVPYGCGEQNMISMTPTVIATHYLDSTNQWDKIGVELRADAINFITQGYTQQLAYRQPSSGYAAFIGRPPSTWLTAYVVKVFSMAHQVIPIDQQVLCASVKWLIQENQRPDGIFKEIVPVVQGTMTGGLKGSEQDASLTAFVLIAMSEAREICRNHVGNLDGSIKRANEYLKLRYATLKRPYTVAIVSYALSLYNQLKMEDTLMRASTAKVYWKDLDSDGYTIESTAYALLTLVKLQKFKLAGPVVRWLREKQFYGDGSESTQAAIVLLQALAHYSTKVPRFKDIDLDVSIALPGRSRPVAIRINMDNALLGRSERTKLNQDFMVVATGTGQGTLKVLTIYNEIAKEDLSKCNKFDLRVSFEEDELGKLPVRAISSFDITICMRHLGQIDSTMAVLDISTLTGFSVDLQHIKRVMFLHRQVLLIWLI
ncbi:complement C3-like [Protopterus annectens]|uniref:complement C3-like n=1 Tax=Protopterus annectens TaxID=7888 RepID=UPI001CFC08FC|nr:complement C3-like [Protopterus annectens]